MSRYLLIALLLTICAFSVVLFLICTDLQHEYQGFKRATMETVVVIAWCVGICVLCNVNPDWVHKDTMSEYTKAKEALERFYEEYPEYKEE